MPKILFIAAHRPNRSPSQRFRFEQYLEYFKKNGFEYDFSFLLSEWDDHFFYRPVFFGAKFFIVAKAFLKRLYDVIRASRYDIIFVQREAYMTGLSFFERRFKKSGAKLIFDFDDSIWLYDTSQANKKYEWLKKPEKTAEIISISDMVFAGNSYLAAYAQKLNKNVKIIPTTIDTDYHKRSGIKSNKRICIGWTGSLTTIKHFMLAENSLLKLKEKYGDKIYFKVIGDSEYINPKLDIKGVAWSLKDEIAQLEEIDIGIMPLSNDDWSKGKCGFKGLQYMALEIPAVMSFVGVNAEIVQDSVNGFLAHDDNEWVEKLTLLIENEDLREKIGKAARKTVIDKYSFQAQKDNYLKYFNDILQL
jgi:glycosyltransferase involved in cell wall biosynthesis